MMHKMPTEQVVAPTNSAQGLSSNNPHKSASQTTAQTLAGRRGESKPTTTAEQDNCVSSSPFRQLPKKNYYRLIDQQVETFLQGAEQAWSSRPAKLKKAMRAVFEQLLATGCFAQGERVGYSGEKLAAYLHCHRTTIIRAIARLRELPNMIRVLTIRKGELSYDGTPARRLHLEFELGPFFGTKTVYACLDSTLKPRSVSNRETAAWVAPCTAIDSTVLPDHNWTTIHPPTTDHSVKQQIEEKIKLKKITPAGSRKKNSLVETRNGNVGYSPAKTASEPRIKAVTQPTLRVPAPAVPPKLRKTFGSRIDSQSPANQWPVAVIRQHRRIAEGKGPYCPISAAELQLVSQAWEDLPDHSSSQQKLQLCKQVSQMALGDSQKNGKAAATLKFTFETRQDGQNPFLTRLARLHEHTAAVKTSKLHELDASFTRVLFGKPILTAPVLAKKRLCRPKLAKRRESVPASGPPLSPQEMLKNIAVYERAHFGITG